MNPFWNNLFILCIFFFLLWIIYQVLFYSKKEGMTSGTTTTSTGGIGNNADAFSATIKNESIRLQDMLLITKYRTSYENVILDLDELLNLEMLAMALQIDTKTPEEGFSTLAKMNQARGALNQIMKYLDKAT